MNKLTRKTAQAIKLYGEQVCREAYLRNTKHGEGASTISLTMSGVSTTRQADAAINAGAEIFSAERIEAAHAEARAAYAANKCPKCGRAVRVNLSLAGWIQCSQFGAPQFRADANSAPCDWQGFTE